MLPLLRLPANGILHTIRLMDITEILGLSLTSKRCKRIVINTKTRADSLQVIIGSSITVVVRNSTMKMCQAFSFTDEKTSSPKRLTAPSSVRISTTNLANPIEMMMDPWVLSPDFDFKKWLSFVINNSIMEMWLAFSITYDEPSFPKSLRAPSSLRISTYDHENPIEVLMDPWRLSANFDFKNWLDHIIPVFHRPDTIDYVKFEQFLTPFDLKDIKEVFGNTNGLDVQHTGCYEYNQLILKEVLPVKHFSVDTGVFQDSSVPKNLLIQNFDTFTIGFHDEVLKIMDLDDLLLINSKDIDVEGLEMSRKEFNKFLKLWIQGATPQLEYLSIIFLNRVEEDEVMNEIKYQKFLSARLFNRHGDREEFIISDGMDFYGKDGLKATVQIIHGNLENYFELFVFHDHCIVESVVRNH